MVLNTNLEEQMAASSQKKQKLNLLPINILASTWSHKSCCPSNEAESLTGSIQNNEDHHLYINIHLLLFAYMIQDSIMQIVEK